MTRLANIEKAGYFPLPPSVNALILSYINAPHGGRILDPCAGEGIALVTLAPTLHADTVQADALYLVAAKVAAALRVNGDTVADDSLAELDEITGNDIVATLARVTKSSRFSRARPSRLKHSAEL